MHHSAFRLAPTTRREFLRTTGKGLGLIAFAGFAPSFLTRSVLAGEPAPEKDRSILVLIQLAGGNDGLNTLIPIEDDNYHRLRPTIGIKKTEPVHKLTDLLALHPSCGPLAELHKEGQLSIIQNVGYPNPNHSHFRSTEIWESASDANQNAYSGWLGRYFDNDCDGEGKTPDPAGIHASNVVPQTFLSDQPHNIFGVTGGGGGNRKPRQAANGKKPPASNDIELLEDLTAAALSSNDTDPHDNAHYLQHTLMDALLTESRVQQIINRYKPLAEYPSTGIGQSLRRIAALIAHGIETRVYYATQGGYDTHANQLNNQARLLRELSEAMAAFQKDLRLHKLDGQVLTMTFSEFGRRPNENSTSGTDHGTAAPLFVMGSAIQNPLVGSAPSLVLEKNRDLTFSTDFRQVYATVLHRWLQTDPKKILFNKTFAELDFLR